nr:hypothetical protein 1 [bacterium]
MPPALSIHKQARISEVHQQRQFAQAALSKALRDMDCLVGAERVSPDTALLRLQLHLASAILGKRMRAFTNSSGLLSTRALSLKNAELRQQLESLLEIIEGL